MAKKTTRPTGGVLAALSNATPAELKDVAQRIAELRAELGGLQTAERLLKAMFAPPAERRVPLESETARKVRVFIEKHGPSASHTIAVGTGLNAQAVGSCATKNKAFVKRGGLIDLAGDQ